MRIGIVLHPFGNATKGLEQHIFDGTCAIIEESADDTEFIVFVKGCPSTRGLPSKATIVNLPNNAFWKLPLFLWINKLDLFVFYTESAPFYLWKKSIVVFFDAAYYYFGSTSMLLGFYREVLIWWRKLMLSNAYHVVTHALTSKRDLVERLSIDEKNITVIYPGFKPYIRNSEKAVSRPRTPFFLYVGPLKERKNVVAIVEAFITFRNKTNLPHQLYIVGRKQQGVYAEKVLRLATESAYSNSILFKSSVTDTELQDLYSTATALVFPSRLEGFGFPVLEALSAGCMVITSSTTSTGEILGSAGMLVNPEDISEIATMMERSARGEYDRERFLREASLQYKKFSWEKSGREWNTLLKNLLFPSPHE